MQKSKLKKSLSRFIKRHILCARSAFIEKNAMAALQDSFTDLSKSRTNVDTRGRARCHLFSETYRTRIFQTLARAQRQQQQQPRERRGGSTIADDHAKVVMSTERAANSRRQRAVGRRSAARLAQRTHFHSGIPQQTNAGRLQRIPLL